MAPESIMDMVSTLDIVIVRVAVESPVAEGRHPWHAPPGVKPGTAVLRRLSWQVSHSLALMVGSGSGFLVLEV